MPHGIAWLPEQRSRLAAAVADAALGTGVEAQVIVHRSSFLVVLRGVGGEGGHQNAKMRGRESPCKRILITMPGVRYSRRES